MKFRLSHLQVSILQYIISIVNVLMMQRTGTPICELTNTTPPIIECP